VKTPLPFLLGAVLAVSVPALRPQNFNQAAEKAVADYRERAGRAADELNRTRARIAAEKAPLLEQLKAAEDRILAAEGEATRLDTRGEDVAEQRRKLLMDLDSTRKTASYVVSLAHDGLKAVTDGMPPGEEQVAGERVRALTERLDDATAGPRVAAALDVVAFLIERTERELGGFRAPGTATLNDTSQVVKGTFAFVGPETFFRPDEGGAAGAVRPRAGAKYPVSYSLPMWRDADAAQFFAGQPSTMLADASGGRALRLKETTGTVWAHIRKGGVVAFAIVGVGFLALILILQKVRDLARMGFDAPERVESILEQVARGATAEAEAAIQKLTGATRALLVAGMREREQPKAILEERLEAVLLEQRLRYERRLPLLAVIATASPLMGLLGTVVGMVRTFALITVFGTGNAGKLSSGISEVLVSTELGLVVAIPTLIAHGFLAHRIQKNLSALERYALGFCTAVEIARTRAAGRTAGEPVRA